MLEAKELMESGLILRFGHPPNRIDLLNQIAEMSFDAACRGWSFCWYRMPKPHRCTMSV